MTAQTEGLAPTPLVPPEDDNTRGPFGLVPKTKVDGTPWHPETADGFVGVWDWDYYVRDKPERAQFDMAIRISDAANTMRAFGLPDAKRENERAAAVSIMAQLMQLFSAALVAGDSIDLERAGTLVDKHEAEFLNRVVAPRHRRNLEAPIAWALFTLAVTLIIGFRWPVDAAATAPGFGDLLRAMSFVVAGTVMGRLLFFAIAFSGRIASMAEYHRFESMIGDAAPISALFDVVVGAAAFAVFQSGLLVIAIGPEGGGTDGGSSAISTLRIAEDGLIAFVFGMLVGLSRATFLARLKSISKDKLAAGAGDDAS